MNEIQKTPLRFAEVTAIVDRLAQEFREEAALHRLYGPFGQQPAVY